MHSYHACNRILLTQIFLLASFGFGLHDLEFSLPHQLPFFWWEFHKHHLLPKLAQTNYNQWCVILTTGLHFTKIQWSSWVQWGIYSAASYSPLQPLSVHREKPCRIPYIFLFWFAFFLFPFHCCCITILSFKWIYSLLLGWLLFPHVFYCPFLLLLFEVF